MGLYGHTALAAVIPDLFWACANRNRPAPFVAGIIGLGLHFAVYNSELIQTAILAVDKGQMEAARTLGLVVGKHCAKL